MRGPLRRGRLRGGADPAKARERLGTRPRDPRRASARLDLTGVALISTALLLLLYPLVQGYDAGWPAWTFVSLAAALPALVLFAFQQARKARRGGSPLVPPALFRERAFTGGVLAALTFFSGVVSFFLVLTLTLQLGLGFSPLHTALTFAPWSLALAAAAGASSSSPPGSAADSPPPGRC
jgi:hypothetical protein